MIAAKSAQADYLCFLNSYSVLLDEDWLSKLQCHIKRPEVGLVGATGSYESHYSANLGFLRKLPPGVQPSRSLLRRWAGRYLLRRRVSWSKRWFAPFPNYHVRTNSFVLLRERMLAFGDLPLQSKGDTYIFESGKQGLTQRLLGMGLEVLLVGRDGKAYTKEQWPESYTFRMGNQENLLVADNQTQVYQEADEATRAEMSERTWGRRTATGPEPAMGHQP
jgi:hypothetical protein